MIISTVSLKGGVGKTTAAVNIAVAFATSGYKVTLIDSDANGNSIYWSGLREESLPSVTTVALTSPAALQKNVKGLYADCDLIVIDGTPALSELTTTIILLSDLIVIPILSSPLDIWATNKFLEKYRQATLLKPDIQGYFLMNRFDPRKNLTQEAVNVIDELGMPVLASKLHSRVAYEESIAEGKGVFEHRDAKAKKEIVSLYNELREILKN